MRLSGWRAAASAQRRRAPFFEGLLRLDVTPGVEGARLLPREVQPAQHPRHARGMVGLAMARLEPAAEIGPGPGAAAVGVRVRPAQDHCGELGLLGRAEPPRRSTLRPVPQAGQALGIVAHDRIAQRLTLHAGEPRRLGPAQPIERMGDRIHPRRRPPIHLPPRQPRSASDPTSSLILSAVPM